MNQREQEALDHWHKSAQHYQRQAEESEAEVQRVHRALDRLKNCQHACVPPCPHTRHYNAVITKELG